jgi:hypothetical protein
MWSESRAWCAVGGTSPYSISALNTLPLGPRGRIRFSLHRPAKRGALLSQRTQRKRDRRGCIRTPPPGGRATGDSHIAAPSATFKSHTQTLVRTSWSAHRDQPRENRNPRQLVHAAATHESSGKRRKAGREADVLVCVELVQILFEFCTTYDRNRGAERAK